MATIIDDEFGEITIRKSHRARYIRLSVTPNGTLRASMPVFASTRGLKKMLQASRDDIRAMLREQQPPSAYENGMRIGKSHSLLITPGSELKVTRQQLRIILTLPSHMSLDDTAARVALRKAIQAALRREARGYLPRRLQALATSLECHYTKVRFSHASTRWGSCSSNGTISLNIALMQLPFELIDYVLIHELCHTKQMNHSKDFWKLVEEGDPEFTTHRQLLKKYNPTI